MTRKKHDLFASIPFHITLRSNNRELFALELSQVWKLICFRLYECSVVHAIKPHALVLMPNHLHLLMTPSSSSNRGVAMRDWVRSITRDFNLKSGRSGRVFGGRYHWCAIHSDRYITTVYKYIYRNPVRAGLCAQVEDYPFSSLRIQLGSQHPEFKIWDTWAVPGMVLNPCSAGVLEWLNQPMPKEREEQIQKALMKTRFRAVRGNDGARLNFREDLLLMRRTAESIPITLETQ